MKVRIIMILAIWVSVPIFAQKSINTVLTSIEENNSTLKALRKTADAQKIENKTGIYLSNPEVEYNYLWGKPGNIGNRTDISVKQSFDIPTIIGMKNKVANVQNNLVELQYQSDRINILLEAKQYCIELIYYNALKQELDVRMKHAEMIAEGYKSRVKWGDTNKLEYNKVQLNLSTVQGEIARINVERETLLTQLKRLNGGTDVVLEESQYHNISLPVSFDDWFAQTTEKNPAVAYARQEIEASRKQVSLSKAMNLPTFSAGYMSEKVVGQKYQGVAFGISVPLWENKNRIKQAKSSVIAAQSREYDTRQSLYSKLQILYSRTAGLKMTADKYRQSLATVNNTDLLKKALDAGEISLLDYILEMGLYYNTVNQMLEAERDYQKAFAELSAFEL
jgi:outer membrane protein TolC